MEGVAEIRGAEALYAASARDLRREEAVVVVAAAVKREELVVGAWHEGVFKDVKSGAFGEHGAAEALLEIERPCVGRVESVSYAMLAAPVVVVAEPLLVEFGGEGPVVHADLLVRSVEKALQALLDGIAVARMEDFGEALAPRVEVLAVELLLRPEVSAAVVGVGEETADAVAEILSEALVVLLIDEMDEEP